LPYKNKYCKNFEKGFKMDYQIEIERKKKKIMRKAMGLKWIAKEKKIKKFGKGL
jgi:hypothetical protein